MPDAILDYAALANEAYTIVAGTGREVTFLKLTRTPDDPAKPWDGVADPRAAATIVAGSATFVHPSSATMLGMSTETRDSLVKRKAQIAIVALPAGSADISDYDEMLDGSSYRKILHVETLQPGDTRLLYFMGVAGS